MNRYNFDEYFNRRGSGALKYDGLSERYGDKDLLPLWVADMDFRTPDFIIRAIENRLKHPILGYSLIPEEYYKCIIDWEKEHHNWALDKDWISFIPGIVKGIGLCLNKFVNQGEKVIIQPPVYHIFNSVISGNHYSVVNNPLLKNGDSYEMDFDNLEKCWDDKCKVLILSNPHNPVGITWDKDTLARLAEFCYDRKILVISDEIHCDMTIFGNKHIPFATVSEKARNCSVTFRSASKTFNIAGVISSYAIIPNEYIRNIFYEWLTVNELNEPSLFATLTTVAAFTMGNEWRKQMLHYIEENIVFAEQFCRENIPEIKPIRPQASFLLWLDCSELGLSKTELEDLFIKKARLALNSGEMFGQGGQGFMRMNIAAPRDVVKQALYQLKNAVDEIR